MLVGAPLTGHFNPAHIDKLRNFCINHSDSINQKTSRYKRIYISRSRAQMRKVENEDQIQSILLENDIKLLHTEDYSFWEQVQLFIHCETLISVHGVGLTNMIFMPKNTQVLEFIIDPQQSSSIETLCYRSLAESCGISHEYLHCNKAEDKSSRTDEHKNILISETALKATLKRLL